MIAINDPAVVEEVLAMHEAYEAALVGNDIERLTSLFWDSEWALRFGADESLYGALEIEAFRKARPAVNLEREMLNLRIVSFGDTQAVVTLEFKRVAQGRPRHGRQTQVWVKFPEGWKIVSAHVSFTMQSFAQPSYAEVAANLIGLPLPAQYLGEVQKNLERAAAIAAPLLATPIADDIESAQVFQP